MKNELFSIVVTTYNQEETVIETLESIYNQTYKNIELIITDDASTDETLNLVDKWLSKNKDRFYNTKILESKENLGISANLKKGLLEVEGEFLKYIAGDDILLPDAIENMVNFLKSSGDILFAGSYIQKFYYINGQKFFGELIPAKKVIKKYLIKPNAEQQFQILWRDILVPAPGSFFRKKVFEIAGYPDDFVKWTDDYALWMKFSLKGIPMHFLPKKTVLWRRWLGSNSTMIHKENISNHLEIVYKYIVPNLHKLSLKNIIGVVNKILYWQLFLEYGADYKAKQKAKWIRLCDPYFYTEDVYKALAFRWKKFLNKFGFYKNDPIIIIEKLRWTTAKKRG